MEPVIFVEVLDRRGRLQLRERFDRFPIALGRAYTNEVILDDRLVSPEHLLVRQTEQGLVIEDRGSANGLFPLGSRRPVPSLPLVSGTEVRIGNTRLRFCTPDQPVEPAVRRATGGVATLLSSRWARFATIAGAIGWFQLTLYLDSYTPFELSDLIGALSLAVLMPFIWAGLWALGTRLVVHEFHMLEHWTVASLAVVVLTVVGAVFEYLDFFVSDHPVVDLVGWPVWGCLLGALVYAHLSVASAMPHGRRLKISIGLAALLLGLSAVNQISQRDDFSPYPDFASQLKPVGAGWLAKSSPAEFFGELGSFEERLDRRAEIERNESPPASPSASAD